jgi:hypothetical protein
MDFSPENLPDLKSTIEKLYFDVKVSTIHADAADDAAISGVCEQALKEEGRLDVFFANVRRSQLHQLHAITYCAMYLGWYFIQTTIGSNHCRTVYGDHENQYTVVSSA